VHGRILRSGRWFLSHRANQLAAGSAPGGRSSFEPCIHQVRRRIGRYAGGMGFYREHVLPVLVDRACGTAGLKKWRSELSSGLSGRVLEIGFGSGLNVEHYPSTVEKVLAVEPSAKGFRIAQRRIAGSSVPVELVGLDGQSIPLPDDSCDDALCTFALCTIPDVDAALSEVRRVLRPGGRFHFLEHGLAPDAGVAGWPMVVTSPVIP
jgi:SAM-dependent methyltransferase